jgi:predicted phage tail protein
MLREIRVYGRLAKFLGRRTFTAAVDSVADAMRFLLANFPGLERHMADQHYRVSVGAYDLSEEELGHPVGQQVIKIAPVTVGAGSTFTQIVTGIALVAAAVFIPGLGIGLAGSTVTAVGLIGASLVLGGVAQLLTPTPTLSPTAGNAYTQSTTRDTELDPQKSYSFSGIQNTSRAGTPVPLIYGETIVGSVVISAGIDTEQVSA